MKLKKILKLVLCLVLIIMPCFVGGNVKSDDAPQGANFNVFTYMEKPITQLTNRELDESILAIQKAIDQNYEVMAASDKYLKDLEQKELSEITKLDSLAQKIEDLRPYVDKTTYRSRLNFVLRWKRKTIAVGRAKRQLVARSKRKLDLKTSFGKAEISKLRELRNQRILAQ